MDVWDIDTTAAREQVPTWLVEFSQIWAAQSATTYQDEYKQIRRLARAAHVPPFVIILRMFRDSCQIGPETTEEQFSEAINQVTDDSGRLLLHLAAVPTEKEQRDAYIDELKEQALRASLKMQEAIDAKDEVAFREASVLWAQSQEQWLILAQNMTPAKARAVMIGFASAGHLSKWIEQEVPGPPPSVFDLY